MKYLISKVSLIVKTYLVGKSEAVLLHNLKLIWKVPILLHTEQIVCRLLRRTVSSAEGLKYISAQNIIHSGTLGYTRLRFYDINLVSFTIAYHGLNEEIRSWPFLSKQIKTGGFWKCKVHCCNFKGFKVTSLQSSAWPAYEPGPPAWVNFPMLSDSRVRPGFKSRPGRALKTCNFEALEVTAMYFTFSETSNLYLFGKERSRV